MSKVSPAQFAVLESCVRYGVATAHIKGMAAWGGWGSTREAMVRKGYIDTACNITDLGRAAYKLAGGTLAVSGNDGQGGAA